MQGEIHRKVYMGRNEERQQSKLRAFTLAFIFPYKNVI